jgi:hypothetical protein
VFAPKPKQARKKVSRYEAQVEAKRLMNFARVGMVLNWRKVTKAETIISPFVQTSVSVPIR